MDQPPALDERGFRSARASVHAHDHAVCAYATRGELRDALGAFVREGVQKRELCVFVHSFLHESDAWKLIEEGYPGAQKLRDDELVLVSLYRDAFEAGAGRIDHEHVGRVVASLQEAAESREKSGVRLFVDASRTYFASDRAREWFDFEAWLGRRLQADVGLVCAYRREDALRPDIFPDVLRTHAYRFEPTSPNG